MTARTPTLTPGEQIANMEILEVLNGTGTKTFYRVRFGCCGTEGTIQREAINNRVRRGTTLCKPCANKAKLAEVAARRPEPPAPPRAPGAEDRTGYWWPMLGRMGPRWGVQDTRAGRVA
jgi:hypothetical protein